MMEMVSPKYTDYLYRKASMNHVPLSGTFELTPRCNMDCKMCYIRKSSEEVNKYGGEKSAEQWIELGKICRDKGMIFLLLTGGEPFLVKDFKYIYKALKKLGLIISINSNATLIDENVIEWLKDDPPNKVNVTLYGGCNETYYKLCGNPKGYEQATRGIKLLKEANIPVKINSSMTQYNIDDLKDIFEFGRKNNIYVQSTSYMFPPIRKDENMTGQGNRFTAEEAGKNLANIYKERYSEDIFRLKAEKYKKSVADYISQEDKEILEGEPLRCRAGRSTFWINWKGEMSPCGMMNEPTMNVFEQGFDKSWKYILEEVEKIRLPIECMKCKNKSVCTVCGAMVVSETGDYSKVPKYICRMTQCFLDNIEELYKNDFKKETV